MTIIIDPRQRIRIELDEDSVPESERAWFDVRPLTVRHNLYLEETRDRLLAILDLKLDDLIAASSKDAQRTPMSRRIEFFTHEMVSARVALAIVAWGNVRDEAGNLVAMKREPIDIFGTPDDVVAAHLVEALGAERRVRLTSALLKSQAIPEAVAQGF